jgi:hypothetical protein
MWQKQESIKRQNKKNNAEHKNNEKNTASKGSCSASEDIFLDLRKRDVDLHVTHAPAQNKETNVEYTMYDI